MLVEEFRDLDEHLRKELVDRGLEEDPVVAKLVAGILRGQLHAFWSFSLRHRKLLAYAIFTFQKIGAPNLRTSRTFFRNTVG
jgi:hypothetical protein